MGKNKKSTVGYKYICDMHQVLCRGPVDEILMVRGDRKTAWAGSITESTEQSLSPYVGTPVYARSLYGKTNDVQDGIAGRIDFQFGDTGQLPNEYLENALDDGNIPAYRGVLSAIYKSFYFGNTPQFRPLDFMVKRINVMDDGEAQWYISKAQIINDGEFTENLKSQIYETSSGWKYLQTTYDDETSYQNSNTSSWSDGTLPFANKLNHPVAVNLGWPNLKNGIFPDQTVIWFSKSFTITYLASFTLRLFVDNYCKVYINRKLIYDENGGFGLNITVPSYYLKVGTNYLVVKAWDDENDVGSGNYTYFSVAIQSLQIDMNPAHIIRECITNKTWGLGFSEYDVDDESFTNVADTLYDEYFGISLLFSKEASIGDFIRMILDHIDGNLYIDRQTGLFSINLVRDDYILENLIELTEDDINKIEDYKGDSREENINSITVKYYNSEKDSYDVVTVDNQAMIETSGSRNGKTITYKGITNSSLAKRVALRDLRSNSGELVSAIIYTDRNGAQLNIGDAFKFSHEDYHDGYLVMRVAEISYGSSSSNKIKITSVQDVFSTPSTTFIGSEEYGHVSLDQAPQDVDRNIIVESPYYIIIQNIGETDADSLLADNSDIGFLVVSGSRNSGSEINADISFDDGTGYRESGIMDFCPSGLIASSVDYTDESIDIYSTVDIDEVESSTHAVIISDLGSNADSSQYEVNEIIRIDSVTETSSGYALSVGRGCLDTIPHQHSTGTLVLFWSDYLGGNEVEYTASDVVDVKLLTNTGSNQLDADDASISTVIFSSRAIRPYPPGNLKFNSNYFPEYVSYLDEIVLTWAHRDRTQQTSSTILDFQDVSIGPENNTTYNIRIYGENDELGREVTGLTGTTYTYTNEFEYSDFGYIETDSSSPIDSSGVQADEYWDYVTCLLHFNGTDGSTTITDEVGLTTWTAISSEIDDAYSVFNESVYCGSSSEIDADSPSNLDIGTGDFTIECWFRLDVGSAANRYRYILGTYDGSLPFAIRFGNGGFGYRLQIGYSDSLATIYSTQYTQQDLDDGVWRHIAVVRISNSTSVFIDGILQTVRNNNYSGPPVTSFTDNNDLSSFTVFAFSSTGNDLTGHIDEFRLTKGVGRYTSNFTPTGPFAAYGLDSNGSNDIVDSSFDSTGIEGTQRLSSRLRIEIESERDGYKSFNKYNHTIFRGS